MHWILFALGAALSWGLYGPSLHAGQTKLGSPFRALLCVGIAYFIVGVIVPVVALAAQGQLGMKGWSDERVHAGDAGRRRSAPRAPCASSTRSAPADCRRT